MADLRLTQFHKCPRLLSFSLQTRLETCRGTTAPGDLLLQWTTWPAGNLLNTRCRSSSQSACRVPGKGSIRALSSRVTSVRCARIIPTVHPDILHGRMFGSLCVKIPIFLITLRKQKARFVSTSAWVGVDKTPTRVPVSTVVARAGRDRITRLPSSLSPCDRVTEIAPFHTHNTTKATTAFFQRFSVPMCETARC